MFNQLLLKFKPFSKGIPIIGTFTILSRIFGYIREIVLANWLGTSIITDSFILSTRIPNLLRKITAEGSLNNAIIPKIKELNQEKQKYFANNILLSFFLIFIIIYFFQQNFQNTFLSLISPGIIKNQEKLNFFNQFIVYTNLTSLLFFFNSIFSAFLNYDSHFFFPALAPIIWNISLISLISFSAFSNFSPKFLGLIYFFSTFLMLFATFLPFLYFKKQTISKKWVISNLICITSFIITKSFFISAFLIFICNIFFAYKTKHFEKDNIKEMQSFFKSFFPIMLISAIGQIKTVISISIGSHLFDGAITLIHRTDKILQIPQTLIFPLTITLLPALAKNDSTDLKKSSIIFSSIIFIPISIIFFFFSKNIINLIFYFGNLSETDIEMMSKILKIYSFGIPAFLLNKIIPLFFFAQKNIKIPFISTIIELIIYIAINIFVIKYGFGIIGISWGYVISSWVEILAMIILGYLKG